MDEFAGDAHQPAPFRLHGGDGVVVSLAIPFDRKGHGCALACVDGVHHGQPVVVFRAVDGNDGVSCLNAGELRRIAVRHRCQRRGIRAGIPEYADQQQDAQHEVHECAGCQDDDLRPPGLFREGTVVVRVAVLPFDLAVAADRKRPQRILGLALLRLEDERSHAHRIFVHFYAQQLRRCIVAEFVTRHQQTEQNDCCNDSKYTHCIAPNTISLVSLSTSKMSSTQTISAGLCAVIAFSTSAPICQNAMRSAKNAATASSLAAFSTIG